MTYFKGIIYHIEHKDDRIRQTDPTKRRKISIYVSDDEYKRR